MVGRSLMPQAKDLAADCPRRALQTQPESAMPLHITAPREAAAFALPRGPDPLTLVLDPACGMVTKPSTTLLVVEGSSTMTTWPLHPRAHHVASARLEVH
jgi:hypothetical protein